MNDFLLFRKMISPWLIQILFWLIVLFCIYIAIIDIFEKESYLVIFEVLILGPIVARVVCELFILFFRINDNLTQIKQALTSRSNTR